MSSLRLFLIYLCFDNFCRKRPRFYSILEFYRDWVQFYPFKTLSAQQIRVSLRLSAKGYLGLH